LAAVFLAFFGAAFLATVAFFAAFFLAAICHLPEDVFGDANLRLTRRRVNHVGHCSVLFV
jgi:hypothetical protein